MSNLPDHNPNHIPEPDTLDAQGSEILADLHSSTPEPQKVLELSKDFNPETRPLIAPYAVSVNSFTETGNEDLQSKPLDNEPPLFQNFFQPEPSPQERIPNLGHIAVLILLSLCGLFVTSLVARAALHFHLFGVLTGRQALNDIHYTLGSEAVFYVLTFGCCLLVFPLIWHKSLLAGLQWRGGTALRLRRRLLSAAMFCFLFALFNGWLVPGPSNSPIDRIFRMPGAAWILFGFGVTLAPIFEEMAFRGFLLPAFCTAFDWVAEQVHSPHPADPDNPESLPQHSPLAVAVASFVITLPFLSCLPYPEAEWGARFLVVALWALGMALWWMRASIRTAPQTPRQFRPLDPNGHPQWSFIAMAITSILTSIPFALMHADQTGHAIGPFVLLLCVSLVLSWVRLSTRSLAASVVVHASYNFLLFTLMFFGTHGFRHLEKM